jgi:hypothetical protein
VYGKFAAKTIPFMVVFLQLSSYLLHKQLILRIVNKGEDMKALSISQQLKSLGLLLAAVAMIFAAQLAIARPAYADANDCGSGQFCIWQHARSEGWMYAHANAARFTCYTLPSAFWDQASSYWNRRGIEITAYTLQNCTGIGWTIYATEYKGSLSWFYNDEMRSYYVN